MVTYYPPPEKKVWIGATSKYDSACACSSCRLSYQSNGGANFPINFPIRGQLFLCSVRTEDSHVTKCAEKVLPLMSTKKDFQFFLLSLAGRLRRILRTSWAVTSHATCNCKNKFPRAFGCHRQISCKARPFTSQPWLCAPGAKQHFKIHIFYS